MSNMDSHNMVTVIEHCPVSPPPGTTSDKTLPLTFFDLRLVHCPSMKNLFFYEYTNVSKNHFIESIIPNLKHSLSLTLKYFYPFAGNLIFPPNSGKPQIRYLEGDSVSMTCAESSGDFNYLTGKKMINAIEFHSLFPQLPPGSMSHDTLVVPIAAFQVTLFPNSGLCVAFNINHVVADGNAAAFFTRTWASITKGRGDAACLSGEFEPCYDRTRLRDPKGLEVETVMWSYLQKNKYNGSQPPLPTNKVRATFVISQATVQQLKKLVLARYPSLSRVTTVTVICAYVWSCMAKARAARGEDQTAEDEEIVHFLSEADCRTRLDPPLPANYVGNCLAPALATVKMGQLKGSDGFVVGAKIIGDSIHKRLYDAGGVLKGAENWMQEMDAAYKCWVFESFSSPKFNIYGLDFGWGRPKRNEDICADEFEAVVISDGRIEGDTEIFLSYPKPIMDAFASIFSMGLQNLDDEVKKLRAKHSMRSKI